MWQCSFTSTDWYCPVIFSFCITVAFSQALKITLGILLILITDFWLLPTVRGSKPGKNVQLQENEIRGLCLKSREIFLSQPILLELEAPLKICGEYCGLCFDAWGVGTKIIQTQKVIGPLSPGLLGKGFTWSFGKGFLYQLNNAWPDHGWTRGNKGELQ